METKINEIEVNGIKYIPKESVDMAVENGLEYVIVRALNAGVFAGFLEKKEAEEVTLIKVRRLWYWAGANSCSALASDGVSKPDSCKFTAENQKIVVKNWIEILPCTKKAQEILRGIKIWTP